jgi:hypothetical protein
MSLAGRFMDLAGPFMGHPVLLLTSGTFHGDSGHYMALWAFQRHPASLWATGRLIDHPALLRVTRPIYDPPGRFMRHSALICTSRPFSGPLASFLDLSVLLLTSGPFYGGFGHYRALRVF